VEFSPAQALAVKQAFIRLTADQTWPITRQFAEETIYALERKCLDEDDPRLAEGYRNDARGARKFWIYLLGRIESAKQAEGENFLEVIM